MNEKNLISLSDTILMERIQSGDSEAIGELILRYELLLRKIIIKRVGDTHVAEDVFGETCLAIVKRLHNNPTGIDAIDKWLKRVARSKCADYWRKEGKHHEIITIAEEYRAAALEREVLKDVRRNEVLEMIDEMEPIYKDIAVLWWQGATIAETSEQLGISQGKVKYRRRVITLKLREHFGVPPAAQKEKQ